MTGKTTVGGRSAEANRMERGYFVDRHVSVLRALLAFGVVEAEARLWIDRTRREGGTDYRVSRDGVAYLIRQMKGYHADVFRVVTCDG